MVESLDILDIHVAADSLDIHVAADSHTAGIQAVGGRMDSLEVDSLPAAGKRAPAAGDNHAAAAAAAGTQQEEDSWQAVDNGMEAPPGDTQAVVVRAADSLHTAGGGNEGRGCGRRDEALAPAAGKRLSHAVLLDRLADGEDHSADDCCQDSGKGTAPALAQGHGRSGERRGLLGALERLA